MEWILLVIFGIIFLNAMTAMAERAAPNKADLLKELGYCPPHQWEYVDIKDHEGNVVASKIVCQRCGPLKLTETPDRMDY